MHQRLPSFLTVLLLLVACFASAEQIFPSSSSANLLGADATFLPIEEAYQLEVSAEGGQLSLDWQIAPGYYLYQHRFQLLDRNWQPVAAKPDFPVGKQIYDEYYERELTVYYEQVTFNLPLNPSDRTLFIESQGCATRLEPRKSLLIRTPGPHPSPMSTRLPCQRNRPRRARPPQAYTSSCCLRYLAASSST